jgi:CubicO group peptidase (beta-lactamase class C family)
MPASPVDAACDALFGRSADEGVSLALVVRRSGETIVERYGRQPANDFQSALDVGADTTLISWSMAKSITHAAVGLLVRDGSIDVDGPAPVAEWAGTPKADITVLQLLEMRSGLHFVEDYVDGSISNCIEMLFGESGPSHAAYAAAQPLVAPPGTVWNYSSGTTNIVARIVGDVVCARAGVDGSEPAARRAATETFLRERLFAPAGMDSAIPKFDDAGDFVGSSFVYATALDFARFGELYARDGVTAAGERILPDGWLDHARHTHAHDPDSGFGYGRHWWTWPDHPGSLACHGYEGQYTIVLPDDGLVVVHLGKTVEDHNPALVQHLRNLLAALLS